MNISELRKNLNIASFYKIKEVEEDIRQVLRAREQLKDILYNPKLNYWEEALKIVGSHGFSQAVNKDRYIVFSLLFVDIRRNGMKFPILIKRKRDDGYPLDKWEILNGFHRMVIAEMLDIKEIPIKFEDSGEET